MIGTPGPAAALKRSQDRRQVLRDCGRPATAQDVVRADVDRDERDLPGVLLQERDRLRELGAFLVRAEPAEAERRRRLAAAAELDLSQLCVVVPNELEQLVGVPLVVAGRRLPARRAADRLEPLRERVAERDVVGRLAARGRTGYEEQRGREHCEQERDPESHRPPPSIEVSPRRCIPPQRSNRTSGSG